MSAVFEITAVSGTSPDWELTVDSSVGVTAGHHLLAELDGNPGKGGIYRVTGAPDTTTINVTDDVDGEVVGKPGLGNASSWEPTTFFELSQMPSGALLWDVPARRDMEIVEHFLSPFGGRGVLELIDPTGVGQLSQVQVDEYETVIIELTGSTTPTIAIPEPTAGVDAAGMIIHIGHKHSSSSTFSVLPEGDTGPTSGPAVGRFDTYLWSGERWLRS